MPRTSTRSSAAWSSCWSAWSATSAAAAGSSHRSASLSATAASLVAWPLAIVVAAWTLVRLLGLDSGHPLVPLVAFTPQVAVASLVVAGIAFALRRPMPGALALAGAGALVACVLPRALDETGAHRGVSLRVLTANMKLGEAAPDALVELVRSEEVDVLSVQELTSGLARRLEAQGLKRDLPHRLLAAGPASSGGGIYSRLPLNRLSRLPSSLAHPLPGARLRMPGPARAVELYDFHPPPPVDGGSVAEWSSDLGSLPDPQPDGPLAIVAGDFNATLDHSELREVLDRGYRDAADEAGVGLQPTWPTGRVFPPQIAVDHVIVDERAGVAEASIHELAGSDHRGVLAEVVLPAD